jgi:hypothetical protein
MSRAKATEVSSPLSLFPFIGVLLSTMGALLVVLICVSRSARDSAVREAAAQQEAASAQADDDSRAKHEHVSQHIARLNEVRIEAEKRLRDDRLRLSHIEDHVRRLQEQLQTLQNAAMELGMLEGEHIDDRKQGEREVERLEKLIAATRDAIAAIKDENKTKKRSYAIIPYEGPHGTQRRPIYIECRSDQVILQPEGIRLTPQDFRPPLGAGNPLASALRAAREYILREAGTQSTKETEPYPLILVRPEGILAYYKVREAIESWDAAFGYELVDNDWSLEFPESNPLLAEIVHYAVEQSRSRQQMLVAAAPRAYGARGLESEDDFAGGEELAGGDGPYEGDDGQGGSEGGQGPGGGGGGFAGRPGNDGGGAGASGNSYAVNAAENGASGEFFANGGSQGGLAGPASTGADGQGVGPGGPLQNGRVGIPGEGPGPTADGPSGVAGQAAGSSQVAGNGGGVPLTNQQPGGSTSIVAGTPDGTGSSFGAPPSAPLSATGGSLAEGSGEAGLMAGNRSGGLVGRPRANGSSASDGAPESGETPSLAMQMNKQRHIPASQRGQNWAIQGKASSSVPIQRTIRVVVRADRLAIQPDSAQAGQDVKGHEISLAGSTAASIDELVSAVQERVQEWGLAGDGLYWRPVLLLSVDPAGKARADDLTRLLRNSGIELKSEATANRPQEVQSRATR